MRPFSEIVADYRESGSARLGNWGTFMSRFEVGRPRVAVKLCLFNDPPHWSLQFFGLWIRLGAARREPHEMMESWGFSAHSDMGLHLNWGRHCKIFNWPWMYDHCRTEVMLRDGSFVPYEMFPRLAKGEPFRTNPEPENRYRETFRYRYDLKSGEVQERVATVTVERREWCWRARPFRWLRWPKMVRTSIDVRFSDEVGERAGSWKGGCTGCGYDMKPGETPEQCLRRMEAERRFT